MNKNKTVVSSTRMLSIFHEMRLPPVKEILAVLGTLKEKGVDFNPMTVPVPNPAPENIPYLILTAKSPAGRIVVCNNKLDLDFSKTLWENGIVVELLKVLLQEYAQPLPCTRLAYILQDRIENDAPTKSIYEHLKLEGIQTDPTKLDNIAVTFREKLAWNNQPLLKIVEILSDWKQPQQNQLQATDIVRFRETFFTSFNPAYTANLCTISSELIKTSTDIFKTDAKKYENLF